MTLKRTIWPGFLGRAVHAAAVRRVRRWDHALAHLRETQERELLEIVRRARGTAFGREHDFARILCVEDYQRQVPLSTYETLSPYIERMRAGERDVLWPGATRYFARSSGSSRLGQKKHLPISADQLRVQRWAGADALYLHLVRQRILDFPSGFTLLLLPSTKMEREGPVFITTNPALASLHAPLLSRPAILPEPDIKLMDDYERRLERIAERYLDHDVRVISGTTCWLSLLFDELLSAARRRGRSVTTVRELWPNLRLLIGGGVTAAPYRHALADRMGSDDFTLIDTYTATEGGVFACSDQDRADMRFIPDRGVFVELVPQGELDAPAPTRLPLSRAEPGQTYAVHVTTLSGLFSYRLGDLVRVTSRAPLSMEFAGRLSGGLSPTQEQTTELDLQRAADAALSVTGARALDYSLAVDVEASDARPRYVFFGELIGAAPPVESFARAFDSALGEQNPVYRDHRRNDLVLRPPEVVFLPEGSVARFMRDRGNRSVQTKFPRTVDDSGKALLRSYAGG